MQLQMCSAALAEAFLAGAWTAESMADRGCASIGEPGRRRWMRRLAHRVSSAMPQGEHLETLRVAQFIERDRGFRQVWATWLGVATLRQPFWVHPTMGPPRIPLVGELPQVGTVGELAAWLEVRPSELLGFADLQGRHRHHRSRSHRHYLRRWIAPRSPEGSPRLLEAPKDRLRRLQRRILRQILSRAPVHVAAHGFVPDRSVFSCASMHAGRPTLLRLDLQSFFAGIHRRRVAGVFRAMGLPDGVARVLAGTCSTVAPTDELTPIEGVSVGVQRRLRALYGVPHLPQGAPSSPALSNLCAYRLDARLAGLARHMGWRYTRYADDLFLSGSTPAEARRIRRWAFEIIDEEGFTPNPRKSKIMAAGTPHRCLGLAVDVRPAVPRRQRKRLEAILTNCVRKGPRTQNRSGHADFRRHLEGRVAWVGAVSPRHATPLRRLLEQIDWK